jgi:hypothetical protein
VKGGGAQKERKREREEVQETSRGQKGRVMITWSCPCSALEKYTNIKKRAKRKPTKLQLRPTQGLFSAEEISRVPMKIKDYKRLQFSEEHRKVLLNWHYWHLPLRTGRDFFSAQRREMQRKLSFSKAACRSVHNPSNLREILLSFTAKRSKTRFSLGFQKKSGNNKPASFSSPVAHESTTDQYRPMFPLNSGDFLVIPLRFPGLPVMHRAFRTKNDRKMVANSQGTKRKIARSKRKAG